MVVIASCNMGSDFTNTCSADNPVEDLDWLKDHIRNLQETAPEFLQYHYVTQASYEDQTVFLSNSCCPNCLITVLVRSCNGEILGHLGYDKEDIHPDALEDKAIIWKPDNFTCRFE